MVAQAISRVESNIEMEPHLGGVAVPVTNELPCSSTAAVTNSMRVAYDGDRDGSPDAQATVKIWFEDRNNNRVIDRNGEDRVVIVIDKVERMIPDAPLLLCELSRHYVHSRVVSALLAADRVRVLAPESKVGH